MACRSSSFASAARRWRSLYCPSDRYDLELFAGYEVGVQGSVFQSSEARETPALDITRVEIIKRR